MTISYCIDLSELILQLINCSKRYQVSSKTIEVFVFNTNLTFLYKIDMEGFKKFQQNIKLPPVEIELITKNKTLE